MARYSKGDKVGVGRRVEQMREERGWSQESLAELMKITRSSLNMKERGERTMTLDEACTLADLFGVTVDELASGVQTENVDIYRATGLSEQAIRNLRAFSRRNPGMMESLNLALTSYDALDALARYTGYQAGIRGYQLIEKDEGDGLVTCRMSPELYKNVLGLNLLMALDHAEEWKNNVSYLSAMDDFDEDRDAKGSDDQDGEEK